MQKQTTNVKILVECAVMAALAAVLSMVKIWQSPLGGSVTLFSMVPIIIIALRHGPLWGFSAAFVYSATQFLFDAGKLSGWGIAGAKAMIVCVLFDYIIAFTILGAAGFFKFAVESSHTRSKKIVFTSAAALFVCALRFASHVFAGATVWYAITKAGGWNEYVNTVGALLYSVVYNMQYMLPETAITLIAAPAVVTILSVIQKKGN